MEEPDSVEGHGCEWYGYETWNPEESWDEPASEHHDVPKVDSDTEYWDKLRTAKTLELGETSDGEAKDPEIEPKYLDDANKPEVPMTVEYNWDDYHWWHGYGLEQEQRGCTDQSLDGDFSAELEALLDAEENPDPEDQWMLEIYCFTCFNWPQYWSIDLTNLNLQEPSVKTVGLFGAKFVFLIQWLVYFAQVKIINVGPYRPGGIPPAVPPDRSKDYHPKSAGFSILQFLTISLLSKNMYIICVFKVATAMLHPITSNHIHTVFEI